MLYRLKQFLWAIQSLYKGIDNEYIDKYLDNEEKELFFLLKKTDRNHCIRVSKDILNYLEDTNEIALDIEIDKSKIVKLALLHDIGKIERPLNIIEKSIVVILDKISKGRIKKYNNIKVIDVYYNHPQKGSNILKSSLKYDDEFLQVVEKHHMEKNDSNKLLEIVQYYDNKN